MTRVWYLFGFAKLLLVIYKRPYQVNLMFYVFADSVFVTNKKKTKLSSSASASNLRPRLCGYRYVFYLAESITTWPQSKMGGKAHLSKGSLVRRFTSLKVH